MKKLSYFLAGLAFIVFWIIRFNYDSEAMLQFDNKISDLLVGNNSIIAFHNIGDTPVVITVAVILLLFLWIRQHNYRGMLFVLLTFAGGTILNQLLKNWVQRPRPDIVDQLTSFSYPSGHTMSGTLYLLTVAFILSNIIISKRKIAIMWIVTSVLIFMIGLSRIAEARHYATDVLGGWTMGFTWFMVCVFWYERRKRMFEEVKKTHLEK